MVGEEGLFRVLRFNSAPLGMAKGDDHASRASDRHGCNQKVEFEQGYKEWRHQPFEQVNRVTARWQMVRLGRPISFLHRADLGRVCRIIAERGLLPIVASLLIIPRLIGPVEVDLGEEQQSTAVWIGF